MQGKVTNERAPGTFTLIPVGIFILTALAGWWYATQQLAKALGYQAQLGDPLFYLWGTPIYRPWQVMSWNYWYHSYAPAEFNDAMKLVFASMGVAVALVIVYAVWVARRSQIATTYGTARWGGDRDIEKAGLTAKTGVVVGLKEDGTYLMHDGPENVGLVAPPRSGKGAGPIISTLLVWEHSAVINDIRRENFDATAGYRAKFSNVIYFNPTDPASAHFNPLFEIRKGPEAIGDAQNVADMIVDPDGTGRPSHWDKTSHALLVAAILHILYAEKDKTMRGLAYFLADPRRDILATLNHMLRTDHGDPVIHEAIASSARENLNRSPNELSGVMSTAMSFLALYRDPIIANNTADSDFRIEDLIHGERPLSLYMVIPPSEINRTRALRRLIWAQIGRKLLEEWTPMHQPKPTFIGRLAAFFGAKPKKPAEATQPRRRVLFLVDEFPALGRMDFFESQLAYTGGYGIKVMLVAQSRNQIDKVYGTPNSLLDLCHVRIYFTPNDDKTAELISVQSGTKTEVHQQKTYTGHRLAPWLAHVMVADQEVGRPLLTPGEAMTFPADEGLVFVAGFHPIRSRKLFYFNDPNLKSRVLPAPPLSTRRPYPYRPKQRPLEWAGMVTAAAAADSAAVVEDDAMQDLEQPIDQLRVDPDTGELLQEGNDLAAEDLQPADDGQDIALRGAFDEQQQHRHQHRDRHGDGPDIEIAI